MSELLRVKVTAKHGIEEFEGKFHTWFTKGYGNGETYLLAVIHNNKGRVALYDLESYIIEFLPEHDPLNLDDINDYALPISGGN